jgi:hypothetical protein
MNSYKENIVNTVELLIAFRSELFNQLINLAMSGEMKEIVNGFEIGDTFKFELDHFDD